MLNPWILILFTNLFFPMPQDTVPAWKLFTIADLTDSLLASERRYYPFLDEAGVSAGLYRLPANGKDEQQPHRLDEIYYVLEGKAKLAAGEDTFPAVPGQILFVKAEVEHRFFEIEEDLLTLVIFSKGTPHPEDEEAAAFSWEEEHLKPGPASFFDQHTLRMEAGSDPEIAVEKSKLPRIIQIVEGVGMLQVDTHREQVEPGMLLYLGAGVEAAFSAKEGGFGVVVYSMKGEE
jgi:mannose-6-phosphate isomerase-like protein (cupin superfamily)